MAESPVAVGDVVAEKYLIEQQLGEGAMGIVFAARNIAIDQAVAIKFLTRLDVAELRVRFAREARVISMLKSEHVVRVYDHAELSSGVPFVVMEKLEGVDLRKYFESTGRLAEDEAVRFVVEALDAVVEAHGRGIVHRDLKPENMFLAAGAHGKRRIKILDFGISKMDAIDGSITSTQMVLGSPYYMSPEQMRSAQSTPPAADVWALGVILYQFVTGKLPFTGENLINIAMSAAITEPMPPRQLRPDLSPALEEIILRCLAKEPTNRPSAPELLALLTAFAGALADGSRLSSSHASATPLVIGGERSSSRSAWGIAAGAAAVVVLGVLTFGAVLRATSTPSAPPIAAAVGSDPTAAASTALAPSAPTSSLAESSFEIDGYPSAPSIPGRAPRPAAPRPGPPAVPGAPSGSARTPKPPGSESPPPPAVDLLQSRKL